MQRVRTRFRAPLVTAGALLLLGTAAYGLTAQSVGGATIYGGQVTGTAFVDENADGAFDSSEFGQPGITVYAYDATETLVGMATTALDGQYTLNVIDSTSIDLRIEFDLSTGPAGRR